MIDCYHGTSQQAAAALVNGAIDVSLGGGELGRGFYMGEYLWVAKAWAANRHGSASAVLKVNVEDDAFYRLDPLLLSRIDALQQSNMIKHQGETRSFLFGRNVVWSPIVGSTRVDADQFKFESDDAQLLLNDNETPRSVV